MDRLRGPDGCPWDREQTPSTLRGYLLEEAYEAAEAIDSGSPEALREELGDLLYQIVFLARIGKEQGAFTADDVAEGITRKMTRRHPHVFGDAQAEDAPAVLRQWEEIKKRERGGAAPSSSLDGIPKAIPALLRAERLGTRAARTGFDWQRASAVREKVTEEMRELDGAMKAEAPEAIEEELGDLLFSIAHLARHLGVDAEAALQKANAKFERRFRCLEERLRAVKGAGERPDPDLLERLWTEVKAREAAGDPPL